MRRAPAEFEKLWSHSTGFYGVWIAFIGKRMGLLESLAGMPMTCEKLARDNGLYLPAVKAWCSAALAYGLIRKDGRKFRLRSGMNSILNDNTHPDYLGGQFAYLALRSLEYGAFDQLFRSGKTLPMSRTFQAIEEATHWDHYTVLREIQRDRHLHLLLTKGCTFLDVGCGTGSFLLKLAKKYPKSEFYGIDPSAKAVAKAKIALKGIPVTVRKLAAENLNWSKFDILYLGESLYAARSKGRVLANCYKALGNDGTILVTEGLIPVRKRTDEDLVIFGMQLDFALQGHRFMTVSELAKLLNRARFKKISFHPLGGSVYLASAKK